MFSPTILHDLWVGRCRHPKLKRRSVMIRYEEKMSEMYDLGRPCSGRSTATLRRFLSYDVAVPLEVPKSLGGGWPSHKPFDEHELKLYDHEDIFKYAFTLLPYMSIDECKSVVEKSPRWQMAIDAGLEVRFLQPDHEIFQRQCLATATTLIIATPLMNWSMVNEYLRTYIAIEQSRESLREKGESLRDYIERLRKSRKL